MLLECREKPCPVTFAGTNAEGFRTSHERVVHGAVYVQPAPDLPYQRHSVTSLSAAQSMREIAKHQRQSVYEYLRTKGPATDEQIAEALGLNPSSARPRRIELVDEGRVRDTGRKARTASGRGATLWEVVL